MKGISSMTRRGLAAGVWVARMVMLGLNDWDRTEVVSGLEEGESVILMSVARLRQQNHLCRRSHRLQDSLDERFGAPSDDQFEDVAPQPSRGGGKRQLRERDMRVLALVPLRHGMMEKGADCALAAIEMANLLKQIED